MLFPSLACFSKATRRKQSLYKNLNVLNAGRTLGLPGPIACPRVPRTPRATMTLTSMGAGMKPVFLDASYPLEASDDQDHVAARRISFF